MYKLNSLNDFSGTIMATLYKQNSKNIKVMIAGILVVR